MNACAICGYDYAPCRVMHHDGRPGEDVCRRCVRWLNAVSPGIRYRLPLPEPIGVPN